MRYHIGRLFVVWLLMILLLVLLNGETIAGDPDAKPESTAAPEKPSATLSLADLIPEATDLSVRLADLERKLAERLDLSEAESGLTDIAADLEETAEALKQLQESDGPNYAERLELKRDIQWQQRRLEKTSKPLSERLRLLEILDIPWRSESQRWQQISSGLLDKEQPDEVTAALNGAKTTIATALALIRNAMRPVLTLQNKAADLRLRADEMTAEIDRQILNVTGGDRSYTYPQLLSSGFFVQIKSAWYQQRRQGFGKIAWNLRRFLNQYGWLMALQAGLALVVILGVHRRRKTLERTEHLQFLVKRPVAAGLFIAIEPFMSFYLDGPTWWLILLLLVAGISFLRITAEIFRDSWKNQAIWALVIILITARSMLAFALPLPMIRLYLVLMSAAGLYVCLRWANIARRQGDGFLFIAGLRLVAVGWAVVLAAELWGKSFQAGFLLVKLADTIGLALAWWLLVRVTRGFVEWIVRRSDWKLPDSVRNNPEAAIQRAKGIIDTLFGVAYICAVLVIWKLYPNPIVALSGLLSFGFPIGDQRITVGLVIKAAVTAYGAFLTSRLIQNIFLKKVYDRNQVKPGDRFSINRLVSIAFGIVGILLALGVLGVRLTHLTIMISALGVGIGFGLQGIVHNFICGLILLFEQPIRVGDTLELEGGQWAEVKQIGLRSSQIRTYDNADVILPNNELIANRVTNWTLSSRSMRLRIPVGVAYGSDLPHVIETLLVCAKDHPGVSARPDPAVVFKRFGESSLDFELRVWVMNFDDHIRVQSELLQAIDQRFRQAGIQIAFPQRDLHLRSVSDSVAWRPV